MGNLILGIDLEGVNTNLIESGIDLEKDRVMEIGAVLWDYGRRQPVQIFSYLIDEEDRPPIDEELTQLTGIDDSMLSHWGLKGSQIREKLEELNWLIGKAGYLMAHNGSGYDYPMLNALYGRNSLPMAEKLWIDSSQDIEFPKIMKNRGLSGLEYAHGFINPFSHRAVTDVLSMLKIASGYPLDRMVALAQSPKVRIVAKLQAPNWRSKREVDAFNIVKNRVSKARFRWNPEEKVWFKDVHKIFIDEKKINYDFEWSILEETSV